MLQVVQRLSNASDWRQRWTAITSIGLGVGQRFPRLGLAILDKAGADPDLRVRTQAVTSLHTILDSLMETPEELRDLARLLEWWMGNARHGPIRRALVIAALSSLLDGANGEYDTPEILVEIASVLGQLLRQKDSRHDAQRLVRVTLQRMPTALNRSVLGKIIQGLTPDERGRDRLVFLLRRLQASDDDRVRAAATELMAEIGSAA